MSGAAEMWERECRYERLHHMRRLEQLEARQVGSRLDWHEREMLRQSRNFLANPIGGSGGRFDLKNSKMVAELDAYAIAKAQEPSA